MVSYVFRCGDGCPDIRRNFSMFDRPNMIVCPVCGHNARHVIGNPNVSTADSVAMALHDSTRASADRPAVVTSLPRTHRRSPRPSTAAAGHRALPRP